MDQKNHITQGYKQLRVDMMNGKKINCVVGVMIQKRMEYSYRNELSDRYSDLKEGLLKKTKSDGETN